MARPPRHDLPGAIHHVTFRGDGGETIFREDRDRHVFLGELEDAVVAFKWALLSFCLMDNHAHLLVECPEAGLSGGMQQLESRYARRLHRRYGSFGHVYQGRFKSKPVLSDAQLLMTIAYIARNPLEAGLCSDPADWPWSSHRAVVHEDCELVDVHRLLALLGAWGGAGRSRYFNLLGCATEGVPRPIPLMRRPPLRDLLRRGDAAAMREALDVHGYGVRAIAAEIGCSPATVSRRVRRERDRLASTRSE